jgi:glyoxylase-like metal-dependent hydrolase (beta-lactamase superfamily II)
MRPTLQNRAEANLSRRDALRLFGFAGAAAALAPTLLRATETTSTSNASAPSLAGAQPGFYRFHIGGFEALALSDGGLMSPLNDSLFGVGEPREKVASVLHDSFLATDKVRVPFSILLVRMGSELVMIDTGCGGLYGQAGGHLVANLAAAGVQPGQITAIILSHVHGDHFGGLLDSNQEPVFKNANLFIHRKEHAFWTSPSPDLSAAKIPDETKKAFISGAQAALAAFKGKWQFISGGDKLLDGIEVIEAFGHTPGHTALLFSSGGDQLLHFVDIAHNHAISFAHPEWIMAFDTQPSVAIDTRKRLFDRAAADRLRVFGAHMPFPALGHVSSTEGHYAYVAEPLVIG